LGWKHIEARIIEEKVELNLVLPGFMHDFGSGPMNMSAASYQNNSDVSSDSDAAATTASDVHVAQRGRPASPAHGLTRGHVQQIHRGPLLCIIRL
jgi:hypothetical protein